MRVAMGAMAGRFRSDQRYRTTIIAAMADAPTTYVALLRGVNVGGNNLVKMSDLEQCFQALDYSNVKTYGNSGNVIFRSTPKDPRQLEAELGAAVEGRFSAGIRVLVRDVDQIKALLEQIRDTWADATD